MFVQVKFGLGTNMDNVYIYDYLGLPHSYTEYSRIDERLEKERLSFPYFYIYVKLKERFWQMDSQVKYFIELRKKIGSMLGEEIIKAISNKYEIN